MVKLLSFALVVGNIFFLVFAAKLNGTQPRADCTATSYSDVASALSSCSDVVIDGITVPAGETLNLKVKDGGSLTFKGTITFDYKEWAGPLVHISGKGISVDGKGATLDGQGPLYWDGLGGNGGITKPKFIKLSTSGGSQINNINVLNCPVHCISISSTDLTLSGWNIDVSAGDTQGGHNTDGFDISSNTANLVIKDSTVKNQDDCVAVNHGSNMLFTGLHCSGSHGLSLSVGMSATDPSANVVSDITFRDCTVSNSDNGIHVKTHTYATTGYIKNVTYDGITMSGIRNYGINIEEDYDNSGPTGVPTSNIPVTGLVMKNIHGTVNSGAVPVYILCGDGGCSKWSWSDVSLTGSSKSDDCNFTPDGYSC